MRKVIFITSGLLFILIAAALIITGSGESDSFFITLSAAAVPFLFTSYWSFYSVYYENRINYSNEYFTATAAGKASIGVFYHKNITIPFFLVLFGSAVFAIITAFLASGSSEDIAALLLALSILYSLFVTVFFTVKIGKGLNVSSAESVENSSDELGFKIAFFFASVATLGLFPIIYIIKKSVRKKEL